MNLGILRAVCEVSQGALGPNAMHKLFSGSGSITTDGLTLVREMKFREGQPIVDYLLRALESQNREAGDGTTRMLILVGALLEAADRLIKQSLHPSRIAEGFKEAASDAIAYIEATSRKAEGIEDLAIVAETALSGKISTVSLPGLSRELANGMARIAKIAGGGSAVKRDALAFELLEASLPGRQAVLNGVVLHARRGHPSAPARVANAKVALIDYPLDVFNKPAYASRIPHGKVESEAHVGEYAEFSRKSKEQLEALIAAIVASGANTVICKRGMGNLAMSMLARHGIFPVEKITREADVRRLILATGGEVVGNPSGLSSKDLGRAVLVEEVATQNGRLVLIDGGFSSRAITILINGVSAQTRVACQRGIETTAGAIASAIDCKRVVAGGGATEAAASRHLSSLSFSFRSKKQLAYQGFAEALMSIPRNLAETMGLHPLDLLSILSNSTDPQLGIYVAGKTVCDTYLKGIVDPLKVVSSYISNATDVSAQILGVDMLLVKPPEKGGAEGKNHHISKDLHGHDLGPNHPRYV
jgi:chaperonin GroEL (HSP60 family)